LCASIPLWHMNVWVDHSFSDSFSTNRFSPNKLPKNQMGQSEALLAWAQHFPPESGGKPCRRWSQFASLIDHSACAATQDCFIRAFELHQYHRRRIRTLTRIHPPELWLLSQTSRSLNHEPLRGMTADVSGRDDRLTALSLGKSSLQILSLSPC